MSTLGYPVSLSELRKGVAHPIVENSSMCFQNNQFSEMTVLGEEKREFNLIIQGSVSQSSPAVKQALVIKI